MGWHGLTASRFPLANGAQSLSWVNVESFCVARILDEAPDMMFLPCAHNFRDIAAKAGRLQDFDEVTLRSGGQTTMGSSNFHHAPNTLKIHQVPKLPTSFWHLFGERARSGIKTWKNPCWKKSPFCNSSLVGSSSCYWLTSHAKNASRASYRVILSVCFRQVLIDTWW